MNASDFAPGDRVLNRHRQSCDHTQEYRDAHKGEVLATEDGVNGGVTVQFDGLEFTSFMVPDDLRHVPLREPRPDQNP